MSFFEEVEPIRYAGPGSDDPLAFRWYDADRVVGDRTMAEHLRVGVCYWHSFAWDGFDIFGAGTLARPWHPTTDPGLDPMAAARR
ncbi:MAG: xylose isomerase, partial [Ilumatobacteraceae bacterium]